MYKLRSEHCAFLISLLAVVPFITFSVSTCWKQGPGVLEVNCTGDVSECTVMTCGGTNDVCYQARNYASKNTARGCLAREFCFGLVNETWKRCETIVEGNDTQCLYCCQYDGCNGEIVTVWPAAVIATDPPAQNKTGNASTNGTSAIPMEFIYAGAGGGSFLIILIIITVAVFMVQLEKKRKMKEQLRLLNANKRRDPTFLEGIMNALGAGDDEKAKGSENEIKMKGGKASQNSKIDPV